MKLLPQRYGFNSQCKRSNNTVSGSTQTPLRVSLTRCINPNRFSKTLRSTALITLLSGIGADTALAGKARNIYGRVELVKIENMGAPLSTKMDTGARTSSLHAINIRQFKKGAIHWVAFDVPGPNSKTLQHFERPLERITKIKNRNSESLVADDDDKFSERPEVKLEVCLRNELKVINVNLVDRSHFVHPVLFGATAIEAFEGIIDPSMRRPTEPFCAKHTATKKVASR